MTNDRFVPSRTQWIAMVLALLFLAGSAGYVIGTRRDGAPGADSVDVGFLQDMISHHEQAVRLSNLELVNGVEPGVQVFAREILHQQSYEIGVMDRRLEDWGYSHADRPQTAMAWMDAAVPVAEMPGLASDDELLLLEQRAGRDADALFIPLMQDHHRGGIHMAEYAAEHATTEFVRTIAARQAAAQKLEIGEMTFARQHAQLAERPVGWVPAVVAVNTDSGSDDHIGH